MKKFLKICIGIFGGIFALVFGFALQDMIVNGFDSSGILALGILFAVIFGCVQAMKSLDSSEMATKEKEQEQRNYQYQASYDRTKRKLKENQAAMKKESLQNVSKAIKQIHKEELDPEELQELLKGKENQNQTKRI